jgi:murein L,D-transpeptidase YafK
MGHLEVGLSGGGDLMKLFSIVILLFSLLASCASQPPPRPLESVPVAPPRQRVDTESVLPWASEEPAVVVVNKACKTLNVYQYGRLTHTYPAVFGRKPGRKLHQGDRRTPLGLYTIIDKDPHPRWSRFMLIDYPNEEDRRRYREALETGKIPKRVGNLGPGGAIGIHGSDRESFNRAGIDWTLGCVSMLSKDIKELYTLVSVGTPVYIHD